MLSLCVYIMSCSSSLKEQRKSGSPYTPLKSSMELVLNKQGLSNCHSRVSRVVQPWSPACMLLILKRSRRKQWNTGPSLNRAGRMGSDNSHIRRKMFLQKKSKGWKSKVEPKDRVLGTIVIVFLVYVWCVLPRAASIRERQRRRWGTKCHRCDQPPRGHVSRYRWESWFFLLSDCFPGSFLLP